MVFQSTSSSSATNNGRDVFTPCPISGLGAIMVINPSLLILRNALGWKRTSPGTADGSFNENTEPPDRKGSNPRNKAPLASAVVFRNALLEVLRFAVFICYLLFGLPDEWLSLSSCMWRTDKYFRTWPRQYQHRTDLAFSIIMLRQT